MKTLYELIRDYRKSKGISQTHIAEVTGIDNKRISNIENGRVEMKAEEFILICEKGLGINPSFFSNQFLKTKNMSNDNNP